MSNQLLKNKIINWTAFPMIFLLLSAIGASAQPRELIIFPQKQKAKLELEIKKISAKIADNPQDAQLYLARASLYDSLRYVDAKNINGQSSVAPERLYENALNDVTDAIKFEPSFRAYVDRGNLNWNRWYAAVSCLNEYLKPQIKDCKFFKDQQFLQNKIATYKLQDRYFDQAINDFTVAIGWDSQEDRSKYLRAQHETSDSLYLQIGRAYVWRAELFERAVNLVRADKIIGEDELLQQVYPQSAQTDDLNRAFANFKKAFETSAEESFNREESAKSIINLYLRRARVAAANNDYDAAISELNEATNYTNARNVDPQRILFERGKMFALKKDYPKAFADYKDSFKYGGTKCTQCLEKRAALYEQIGDLENALADYQQIKYTSPPGKIRTVAYRLANNYLQKSDFERAVSKLSTVLGEADLRPEGQALNKKVLLMRAAAYRKLKQENAALEDERRAAEIKIPATKRF